MTLEDGNSSDAGETRPRGGAGSGGWKVRLAQQVDISDVWILHYLELWEAPAPAAES